MSYYIKIPGTEAIDETTKEDSIILVENSKSSNKNTIYNFFNKGCHEYTIKEIGLVIDFTLRNFIDAFLYGTGVKTIILQNISGKIKNSVEENKEDELIIDLKALNEEFYGSGFIVAKELMYPYFDRKVNLFSFTEKRELIIFLGFIN